MLNTAAPQVLIINLPGKTCVNHLKHMKKMIF